MPPAPKEAESVAVQFIRDGPKDQPLWTGRAGADQTEEPWSASWGAAGVAAVSGHCQGTAVCCLAPSRTSHGRGSGWHSAHHRHRGEQGEASSIRVLTAGASLKLYSACFSFVPGLISIFPYRGRKKKSL